MLRPVESTRQRSPAAVLAALALWSVAFGYLEGAVVVYLRELYHPAGFRFPLTPIPARVYGVEVLREAATIVLLWGVAWLVGGRGLRRFGAFAFCFGAWDLVYYGTLKATLNWPASLLDWDILFLIPVPWTGPVLAPALISLGLVLCGGALVLRPDNALPRVRPRDIAVEIGSGALLLATFFWNVPAVARGREPEAFPWILFAAGLALGMGWFYHAGVRRRVPAGAEPEPERKGSWGCGEEGA